jgi:dynein heavy chain, axonemal
LTGEWNSLDAVAAEKWVEDSIQLLNKSIRNFRDKKIDSIMNIALKVKVCYISILITSFNIIKTPLLPP